MGGWWEWAPPDNHFRMPYWKQIDPLMGYIERLSYLLSQGYHNCDVAIIYPTEPVVAEMDGKRSVNLAFETGERLYDRGIDFDFIDYQSIARSVIKNGELNVADERYKVLIVPSMKAIRYSSLKKIEEFRDAGGIVVNIGERPEANDKTGMNDLQTNILITNIFSSGRNMIHCSDANEVLSAIEGKYDAGFKILTGIDDRPYVMHRIIGKRDVYALYNLPEGTSCFFRSKGSAELWDPWEGTVSSLSDYAVQTNEGTEISLPLTSKEIQIIVFDPENTGTENKISVRKVVKEYVLDDEWEFELKPSLDNRWGDFELPASDRLIGAEVREIFLSDNEEYSGEKVSFDESWKSITCGFGPQFLKLGPLSQLPSDQEMQNISAKKAVEEVLISGKKFLWKDYSFSWQVGVEGDYGHQGYHGLKGEMYDNFIRLGALEDIKMSLKRVPEAGGNYYVLLTSVIAPEEGDFEVLTGETRPAILYINNSKTNTDISRIHLKKGSNTVVMVYDKACETYLICREPGKPRPQRQPVAMSWYKDYGVLPFGYPSDRIKSGLFGFASAPGLKSLVFSAYGKVELWIDGVKAEVIAGKSDPDGLTEYNVNVKNRKPGISQVIIKIIYKPGYFGGASIPKYITENCGKGEISPGDWSENDGLKSYSGGAWYRKSITLDSSDVKNKIEIDLGDLVASAELFINGKSAGIKVSPPWTFNLSEYAIAGENQIEVLVYNTLANNYTAIPTRYQGSLKSGLTGPVRIIVKH